jgi:hypothetical protein
MDRDLKEASSKKEIDVQTKQNPAPSDNKAESKEESKDVVIEDASSSDKTKPASGEGDATDSRENTKEKLADKNEEAKSNNEFKDMVTKTETPAKKPLHAKETGGTDSTSNPGAYSTPAPKGEIKESLSVQSTEPISKPLPVTFASVMSSFTDAASKYKDQKCPESGKWEGFFENITGRNREKFQNIETQKVDETFHLFFNATPEAGATYAFADASSNHVPKIVPKSATDPSLVQVRGCGTNQFGTFEIYGYLDLSSMTLEIQRQYVVTERKIRRRSRSAAKAARPTSTRKRQPSWKRMTYDPDEDTYGRKKRAKVSQGQQRQQPEVQVGTESGMVVDVEAVGPASDAPAFGAVSSAPLSIDTAAVTHADVQAATMQGTTKPSFAPSTLRISLPAQGGAVAPASSGPRRKSGGGGAKRRSSSKSGTGFTPTSTSPGSSPYIRLPAAGDPKKARWRSAHFLYYQRPEPEQQQQQPSDGNTAAKPNSPKVAPKPKYVIYEGELVDGKREGRGICLYSNSNLYEGEWRRDKEHGYGKLMTSDRRQIIYEGEWERGKIQGNGTYYYGSSNPANPGSRYIGEFRESLRNGTGRYYLEGGAVYDGQWRDGMMNGRGVFTWPDNSVYDGEWKDGKRNGQGLLRSADGFVYDGQWVNNAMEGKGLAIYPSGQRYEGSWNNGRREGRGTMHFVEGAVYEGRFRDDAIDGQGTMKMLRAMEVPRGESADSSANNDEDMPLVEKNNDFMIPLSFQSDLTSIHNKAGFTAHGE